MEVHKNADPKFARTLEILHPYLENLVGILGAEENESLGDSYN